MLGEQILEHTHTSVWHLHRGSSTWPFNFLNANRNLQTMRISPCTPLLQAPALSVVTLAQEQAVP